MTIWEKLNNIDKRIIYVLFVVVTVIPTLRPMSLPMNITDYQKTIFDFIEKLQAGDIVVMSVEYSAGTMGELHPPMVAVTKHLIKKNIKAVIVAPYNVEGVIFAEKLVDLYLQAGKKYGEDVVNLGYTAGNEQAITAMAESFAKTFPRDHRGNPIESLPLMQQIKSAKEAKFIIQNSAGGLGPLGWIRQVHIPYKTPVCTIVSQVMMPSALPFYQAGQLVGVGGGLRFSAEYEILLKEPAAGLAGMGAQSFGHLYFLVLLILGNIGYFMMKKTGKEGASA